MRVIHVTLLAVAAALVVMLALAVTPAQASTRHINGVCGLHRGQRVIPSLHRYHVRVGPRNGTTGGSHRCHGRYVPKGSRLTPDGLLPWSPFDFTRWNWHGILDVGVETTVMSVGCASFAAAFAGEFPSAGLDTVGTAAAGAACVGGAKALQGSINDDFYPRR